MPDNLNRTSGTPDDLAVIGAGWLDSAEFGCVRTGLRRAFSGELSEHPSWVSGAFFTYPVKNFKRFDPASRIVCHSVALALRDCGISYAEGKTSGAGILMTSTSGCLDSNTAFFTDYIQCGRTLARGGLFIYTLPSSPASEAAIHFGLTGPTLHFSGNGSFFVSLLETARDMIIQREAESILAVDANAGGAVCMLIADAGSPITPGRLCSLSEAVEAAGGLTRPSDIHGLARNLSGKGGLS